MAKTGRLFLALWPDDETRDTITSCLKQHPIGPDPGNPVKAENLHITLRYLGSIDQSQLACIQHAMAQIPLSPFVLQLDHQGYWRRPKVGWLGCHQVPEALRQLVAEIEVALLACGIAAESRPYVPHLTIRRKVTHFPATEIHPINWPVDSFVLALSESFPEGVRYSVLHRWS